MDQQASKVQLETADQDCTLQKPSAASAQDNKGKAANANCCGRCKLYPASEALACMRNTLSPISCPVCLPEEVCLGLHACHDLCPLGHECVSLALHLRGHGIHDDGVPAGGGRQSNGRANKERSEQLAHADGSLAGGLHEITHFQG